MEKGRAIIRSSMALACAVVPSEWNECIRLFCPRGTAAQAKAMLLRLTKKPELSPVVVICARCKTISQPFLVFEKKKREKADTRHYKKNHFESMIFFHKRHSHGGVHSEDAGDKGERENHNGEGG